MGYSFMAGRSTWNGAKMSRKNTYMKFHHPSEVFLEMLKNRHEKLNIRHRDIQFISQ
jgi:hypothetical protein